MDARPSPLLREMMAAWPPGQPDDGRGYRRLPLAELRPLDALELRSREAVRSAVVVVEDPVGRVAALPLANDGSRWRMASAGDGASEALVAALGEEPMRAPDFRLESVASTSRLVGERAIEVDQTNRSVVVGEALIVKWYATPGVNGRRAATMLAHLSEVGFGGVPRLHGTLTWAHGRGRAPAVLAIVDEFLPGSRDGWEWCVEAVEEHAQDAHSCGRGCPALSFPSALGRLAAELHAALATPTERIPEPVRTATGAEVTAWLEAALGDLDIALSIQAPDRHLLVERASTFRADVRRLADASAAAVQPIHGDLHVGQVLRGRAGLRVIDFDGPPGEPAAMGERHAAARDVAHLLLSLELVAEVARHRLDGETSAEVAARWAERARTDLLVAYRAALTARTGLVMLDERLIRPFMAWQLCRELRYAAGTLPRWRYAPMGALSRLYPATSDDHS